MSSRTLEEAIALGRGVERPFRCHVHGGTGMHASVNVVKQVWYCFSCHAKGAVDSNRVPTTDELLAMLQPEVACREYSESWLETYGHGGYWLTREPNPFPLWLCWLLGLGEDPWTGEGTYPVHTPRGRLAGVCRRAAMPGPGPKYRYPPTWSAARSLFGTRGTWSHQEVLTIEEGAADAAAVMETGYPAVATYGAGVHAPQVELIAAMSPRLILLGFDMDDAGQRATEQAWDTLSHIAPLEQIDWKEAKDPAELTVEARLSCVSETVGATQYGAQAGVLEQLARRTAQNAQRLYVEENP